MPDRTEVELVTGIATVRSQMPEFVRVVSSMVVTANLLTGLGADGENDIVDRLAEIQQKRTEAQRDVQQKTDAAVKALKALKSVDQEKGDAEAARKAFLRSQDTLIAAMDDYYKVIEGVLNYMQNGYANEVQRVWKARTKKVLEENFAKEHERLHDVFWGIKVCLVPIGLGLSFIPVPFLGAAVGKGLSTAVNGAEAIVIKITSDMAAEDEKIQIKYAGYSTEKEREEKGEAKKKEIRERQKKLSGEEKSRVEKVFEAVGVKEAGRFMEAAEHGHFLGDLAKDAGVPIEDAPMAGLGLVAGYGAVVVEVFEDLHETIERELDVKGEAATKRLAATIEEARQAKEGSIQICFGDAALNVQILGEDGSGWAAVVNGEMGHFSHDFAGFVPADGGRRKMVEIKAAARKAIEAGTDPQIDGGSPAMFQGKDVQWYWDYAKSIGPSDNEGWKFKVRMTRQQSDDPETWQKWNTAADPFWGSFEFTLDCRPEGASKILLPFSMDDGPFTSIGELKEYQEQVKDLKVGMLQADRNALPHAEQDRLRWEREQKDHVPDWGKFVQEAENNPTVKKALKQLLAGNRRASKATFEQLARELKRDLLDR